MKLSKIPIKSAFFIVIKIPHMKEISINQAIIRARVPKIL
tara:strand:+ start:658 stop:777 length:120 start_codon:yes stop_codon:yes gene_type:complete